MRTEEILKERNMPKAELARRLGVHRQNMNSLLRNPRLDYILKIAQALEVEPWELFASREEILQTEKPCP